MAGGMVIRHVRRADLLHRETAICHLRHLRRDDLHLFVQHGLDFDNAVG